VGTTDTSPASNHVAGSLRASTGLVQASVSGNPAFIRCIASYKRCGMWIAIRRAGSQVGSIEGIDQSKLVPLLTAALQEALTKIETLEARITALENA
jgi:hypothetical protein